MHHVSTFSKARHRIIRTALIVFMAIAGAGAVALPASAQSTPNAVPAISAASNHAAFVPEYQLVAVHPRVSGGGFNGNVEWSGVPGAYVEIWGEVWSFSGDTYVYLSWNSPTHHNQAVGVAGANNTVGVPVQKFSTTLNPSNIEVTVCNTNGGWHCGTPVAV
jgi:hypothetical protein